MRELRHLLTDWPHWAFEEISDGANVLVVYVANRFVPARFNPFKRWLKRHDREAHGA